MSKIKDSKCFGIAWDGTVKECKLCEVSNMCKQKTMANVKQVTASKSATPVASKNDVEEEVAATVEETKPAKATKKAEKKPEAEYSDDMPDFKPMDCDELIELANERGLDIAQFDKYTSAPIKKMRVTMALKKTYQVK